MSNGLGTPTKNILHFYIFIKKQGLDLDEHSDLEVTIWAKDFFNCDQKTAERYVKQLNELKEPFSHMRFRELEENKENEHYRYY